MQVLVPGLKARYGHYAAAYILSPGITEIVIFGGTTTCPPNSDTFIANTTVLRFGECQNILCSL